MQEDELDAPPAVAERAELRLAPPRVVLDRDLARRTRPLRAALNTISSANSMPGERRSSRGRASRRTARRPQYASETLAWNMRLIIPVMSGLPIQRCDHGIAPRVDAALEPCAEHHVGAVLELVGRTPGSSPKSYVSSASPITMYRATGGGEAGEVGVPVPALRLGDDARALAPAISAERSVEPLSTTTTSPVAPTLDALPGALDDGADRLFLVEAGNDH